MLALPCARRIPHNGLFIIIFKLHYEYCSICTLMPSGIMSHENGIILAFDGETYHLEANTLNGQRNCI